MSCGDELKQCRLPDNMGKSCKFFSARCALKPSCKKLSNIMLGLIHADRIIIGRKVYVFEREIPGVCMDCIKWHRKGRIDGLCYETDEKTAEAHTCDAFVGRRNK